MADRRQHRSLSAALLLALALAGLGAATAGLAAAGHGQDQQADLPRQPAAETLDRKIDAVFARWSITTPGCALGVSVDDKIVLQRAYGMADLEHDVIITPETILEAGSVSKQFTAASVLLLARDGRLGLDDQVRKYVPELPEYGAPLTVRMMLQHTSGLRDWGSVASISGWPRTSRVHTHAHVLDIASRQRALNFTPGTEWSYSNTGYNLAAIIVDRVSGQPFAEFARQRIFEPLGMTRTSWRDDHTRIVKGRAVAYADRAGRFSMNMPFENVHGNCGLLTTVGDLLRWNANFATPKVGDAELVRLQQEPGRFNDGRPHSYGMGLYIGRHRGLTEIYHSGTTAGYQAFLTRFPDQRLSVAVLCNVTSASAGRYARAVADLYLAGRFARQESVEAVALPAGQLEARGGLYRNAATGVPLVIAADKGLLRADNAIFVSRSPSEFVTTDGSRRLEFDASKGARLVAANGTAEQFEPVAPAKPTSAQLADYAGTYTSDEAEVTMTIFADEGTLRLRRRPDTLLTLRPVYADAFSASLGTIIFRRDPSGQVVEFSVVQDRVWDLRFRRQQNGPAAK